MPTLRTTLAALLFAAPLLAAPGGPGPAGHRFDPGPDDRFAPRGERIAELLDLDAAQRAAFEQMRADGMAAARPKLEQLRTLHEEMRTLLDGGSTDVAAIGTKALAIHRLRGDLRAEREAAKAEFVKLLSDEQRFAYEALEEARQGMHEQGRGTGGFAPHHGGRHLRRD